ncbi:zinc-binding alcohol dehydrogenase family protein [Rurimicrobium arvi]|uniref:Zinc-binding alcohol dehydrogenase family protein n=1 Tax=Rurimicrobium arvi TaxID=2049916 RepID=A0ABP8MPQ8_9BACT
MKAAVVFEKGSLPRYTDQFPAPVPSGEHEQIMQVKAVSLKHLDKMRASGQHYSTQDQAWQPRIPGGDAAGVLADGTRVYALGISGTLAETTLIDRNTIVHIPEGLDDLSAAALPNAVMGSAMALRFRAQIQPGQTVLINGATGFTGKVAVQLAKHYGAACVIATGRNSGVLESLRDLGADHLVHLQQEPEAIQAQLRALHQQHAIDIVLDYLWGASAELMLDTLKGNGSYGHPISYVSIGGMAGDKISLSSSILRGTDIRLCGSGLGSWSAQEVQELIRNILPELFKLAAAGGLRADTQALPLEDIARVWQMDQQGGTRIVVTI